MVTRPDGVLDGSEKEAGEGNSILTPCGKGNILWVNGILVEGLRSSLQPGHIIVAVSDLTN